MGSTIDLWYTDIHPLLSTQYHINATAYSYTAYRARLSDHMPVAFTIRPRDAKPPGRMPIPRWHPRFAAFVQDASRTISFDLLHPNDAIRRMKQLFKNAARSTLRAVMSKPAATNEAKVQAVFQLARALARGDARLARRATQTFPPLAACVKIQHTCVTLAQPAALERVAASVIRADLATRNNSPRQA